MLTILSLLILFSCSTSEDVDSSKPLTPEVTCSEIMNRSSSPSSMRDIEEILTDTLQLVPELDSATIELRSIESESTFLAANVDLSTATNEPFDRSYIVQINPVVLKTELSGAGTAAILVHELKHILDYTRMDALAFAEFGLWYAQGDVAEYERATDLFSMERGCGKGLIEFRLWLYNQISAEVLEEKKQNYYTPEEIQEWLK